MGNGNVVINQRLISFEGLGEGAERFPACLLLPAVDFPNMGPRGRASGQFLRCSGEVYVESKGEWYGVRQIT
jgi:hypothetical protein